MTIDELEAYITARGYCVQREGASLTAGGGLDLGSLTTLPEGAGLTAGGYLDLGSLTTLPEGASLTAGGYLGLGRLTTLPEGAGLTAGGYLGLRSLTSETQRYQGKTIRLRTIDGICTRLIKQRTVGGVTVWSAQYFRGDLTNDPRCYVAQDGDEYAHGETAEKAMRDLRFKVAQRDLDPAELVADIKRRGTVTFNDYRLLTGACESGLSEGLRALGKEGAEEMPLGEALALCSGAYGGSTFRKLMGVAQ
jgi:hypothetical protein